MRSRTSISGQLATRVVGWGTRRVREPSKLERRPPRFLAHDLSLGTEASGVTRSPRLRPPPHEASVARGTADRPGSTWRGGSSRGPPAKNETSGPAGGSVLLGVRPVAQPARPRRDRPLSYDSGEGWVGRERGPPCATGAHNQTLPAPSPTRTRP